MDEVNPKFEFAVKLPKLITHVSHFTDLGTWEKIKSIGEALDAKIMVARIPRNFTDKAVNIKKIEDFMGSVGRKFKIGLEAPEWKRETIEKVFSELDIIHIVNPFEEKPIKQKTNYYHLNGIGATMYRYRFKDADLERLKGMVKKKDYVLFNNIFLYEDSMRFMELSK